MLLCNKAALGALVGEKGREKDHPELFCCALLLAGVCFPESLAEKTGFLSRFLLASISAARAALSQSQERRYMRGQNLGNSRPGPAQVTALTSRPNHPLLFTFLNSQVVVFSISVES